MKKLILFASLLVVGALLGYQIWSSPKTVKAVATCKSEHAECFWNASEHDCCADLSCNFWKKTGDVDSYKCEAASSSPTSTPTNGPTESPEPTETPNGTESPELTPTNDGDVCKNIDGIQTGVPEGKHLDASGLNCVEYQLGGAPAPAEVSSTGEVLGASTLAGTGIAEEGLFNLIFALGSLLSAFGIRKFATSRVK